MWYRALLITTAACALFFVAGCAKYPPGGASGTGPELVISMTTNAPIDPNSYYFVVFDVSNDPHGTNGPVPVIAVPWGNGFATSQYPPASTPGNPGATSFMEYYGAGIGYVLYKYTNNLQYQEIGVPPQSTAPNGGNTLQFSVLLSQLATPSIPASQIKYIQVNFITTNILPQNPEDTSVTKYFDALGNSLPGSGQLNDYITIPTTQATIYNNQTNPIEPSGDVEQVNGSGGYFNVQNQEQLDITNWSVQVVN